MLKNVIGTSLILVLFTLVVLISMWVQGFTGTAFVVVSIVNVISSLVLVVSIALGVMELLNNK
tara:strand:+ start:304 stop:492 length:189 start_codon:yes stop_codon:yes gene_type:complete